MIVNDVLVGAHRHHCCLNFDFMENFLLWHFHNSGCPALLLVFTIEGLIDCTHSTFSKLLCETVNFVWICGQKLYLFDFFVKILIGAKCVIGDLLSLLQSIHNLNHDHWVVLDDILVDIVL